MSRRLRLTVDTLESRLCLSAVAFVPHPVVADIDRVDRLESADLNGDGFVDIIVVRESQVRGRWVSTVSWIENVDGVHFVSGGQLGTTEGTVGRVILADLESDGDVDVLLGLGLRTAVYENIDGNGAFVAAEDINHGDEVAFMIDTRLVDLDTDGDLDLLAVGGLSSFPLEEAAWWQENLGDNNFGFPEVFGLATFYSVRSIAASDIDEDGKLDVAVAIDGLGDLANSVVFWHRNQGNGAFSEERLPIVTGLWGRPGWPQIEFGDVDGDVFVDAVVSTGDALLFVSGVDAENGPAALFDLPFAPGIVVDMELHDFDGDGEAELVVPVDRGRTRVISDLFFYDREGESFDQRIIGDGIFRIAVSDFDNDGDPDIFAHVFRQGFEFLENVGTDGAAAGDLDSDGEVGFQDFLLLSQNFGRTDSEVQSSDGDLDDDGDVDFEDFLALARNYGQALL